MTKPLPTPLAVFVRQRLDEQCLLQSDFCRANGFDQGLLSKIMSSAVTSLSAESILRLAVGLDVPAKKIFELLERMDLYDLAVRALLKEFSELSNEPRTVAGLELVPLTDRTRRRRRARDRIDRVTSNEQS